VELVTGATGNLIAGNLIGSDESGEVALGNSNVGVVIYDTSGNTVGGLSASPGRAPGNVISGNRSSGVLVSGPSATGNLLQGNLIGTDSSGLTALPNASSGVTVDSAPDNLIGGDQPGDGNVIAANRSFGVFLLGTTATGNRIAGNLIGTNSAGAANLGNALDGLVLSAAPGNTIGGLAAADRNVISGNGGNGINVLNIAGADGVVILGNFIGTNPSGLGRLGNNLAGVLLNGVSGTVIAGGALPNLISGNGGNGIYLLGSSAAGTVVWGSMIGTDITGTADLGNGGDGIAVENASAGTIGGTAPGQRNLISGNAGDGIQVYGSTASNNVLLGNTIGTDTQGTAALPNAGFGISIEGTTDNLVQTDLISGNAQGGVQITGFGAGGNNIFGCTIGTDGAGDVALGNGLASLNDGIGVFINGAEGNQVGGDAPGQGNLISGNATAGVYIFGRFAAANTVQGNRIGTNATGQKPIVQNGSTPSQQVGVLINDAPGLDIQDVSPGPGNTIGGSTASAGNLISGNIVGIMISGAESSGNVVAGNLIGPSGSGGAGAGNTVGVYINGAPGNTIGGVRGNVVSGNSSVGIYILGSPSTGNVVAGNLIGLAPDGIQRLPNPTGVYIENAPGNVIGGASASAVNVISANSSVGVYILGGQSVGNVVEGNLIGSNTAGGRAGNRQYGVLLYNAPTNTVVRSGPRTNRITGSGIANYREFLGPAVSSNSSGGRAATQPKAGHRVAKSASSRARLLVGQTTPAGPLHRSRGAR
jgi:titin